MESDKENILVDNRDDKKRSNRCEMEGLRDLC